MVANATPASGEPTREVQAFLAFMRQELRTPIHAIVGYSQLLLDELREEQPAGGSAAADLERIAWCAWQLSHRVDELLAGSDRWDHAEIEAHARELQHDLRTPLSAVIGYAEILLEELDANADADRIVDVRRMVAAAERVRKQLGHVGKIRAAQRGKLHAQVVLPGVDTRDAELQQPEPPRLAGKLLVVDADAASRDVLKRRLTRRGHLVLEADSGEQALRIACAGAIDLMLLDLLLPGMDGSELIRRFRQDERLRGISILVISALDQRRIVARCVALGAADVLRKPFDQLLLDARVQACLERKRLADREADDRHDVGLLVKAASDLQRDQFAASQLRSVTARDDALGNLARVFSSAAHEVKQRERELNQALREQSADRYEMVPTKSPRMREVLRLVRAAARSQSTVLLLGESGSGKEILARSIHGYSARDEGPFVAVNCTALTPSLLESELFGHERGAFTGAIQAKQGKFELAHGGTIFLDEIGDMAADLQTKLLRVLQEREVERVGGNRSRPLDVRVVAATNKNLAAAMQIGNFREDLYYRLSVVTIVIPPLRERPEDIPALCRHFLVKACRAVNRPPMTLSDDALAAASQYGWPGNVRELANVMERIAVLMQGDVVQRDDLALDSSAAGSTVAAFGNGRGLAKAVDSTLASELALTEQVKSFKRRIILDALAATGDHQIRAAHRLGISQSSLSRMMKGLGLR